MFKKIKRYVQAIFKDKKYENLLQILVIGGMSSIFLLCIALHIHTGLTYTLPLNPNPLERLELIDRVRRLENASSK